MKFKMHVCFASVLLSRHYVAKVEMLLQNGWHFPCLLCFKNLISRMQICTLTFICFAELSFFQNEHARKMKRKSHIRTVVL